jgi:Tetratricopeptide repeat
MTSRISFFILCVLLITTVHADDERPKVELKDIFFGEVLYFAYQDQFFDAITKLDSELNQYYSLDEPGLDPFHLHSDHAEFSVGDLELSYRMHQKAGRAIKSVLEGNVSQPVKNEAAYRLAKIYLHKNQAVNALDVIERIKGKVPESIRVEEQFLRAQIYISTGEFLKAIDVLRLIEGEKSLNGFAAYNLGIALIQSGNEKEGVLQLDKLGKIKSDKREVLAIVDKANLMLGYRMLESGSPQQAQKYFERVRLDGPFSNRALLGSGWVDISLGRYKHALVPWTILHKRKTLDISTQESMLAVPYAYSKLDVHGKAALMYGHAMDVFGTEITSLDSSIKSIREGKFLSALLREESKQDKNWLLNLRSLKDTPETHYILELMASHDFQQSLKNYYDLAELRKRLSVWISGLDVYEEMTNIRRKYFVPLLPVVEKQFKKLDSRIKLRIEQRDQLDKRLKSMLITRRPDHLATSVERSSLDSLQKIELYLSSHPQLRTDKVKRRLARLKGVVNWNINYEYSKRLTTLFKEFNELEEMIDGLNIIYASFIRTRQAATQSYEGYSIPIRRLRTKLKESELKVTGIMARQGRMLENMAVNDLDQRRQKLESYQIKARFALAESYDRATKAQKEVE